MIRILTIAHTVWLEMIRRKDLYVLLILLGALLFALISVNVFGLNAVVRYVADIGLLFAWLFSMVLAVSLSGRQLPQEEAKRTIYSLLAKPVTRAELLVGKWLGTWSAASVATGVFYFVVFLVVKLRGGELEKVSIVQAVLMHFAVLGCVTALTLALSTRMSYGAAACVAYVFSATSLVIVPSIPELLLHADHFSAKMLTVIYFAIPHFDLFDMRQRVVHSWGPAPWGVIGEVISYGVFWVLIFLLLAWLGYRKKAFQRGNLG